LNTTSPFRAGFFLFLGVIKNTMKNLLAKLKNRVGDLRNGLIKHRNVVYTALIALILSMSFFIVQEIKHTAELLKIHGEKAVLLQETQEAHEFAIEGINVIMEQRKIIDAYQINSQLSKDAINAQSAIIAKLVEYLKSIGHWPPKLDPKNPKPPDRNKWTI
jgi:hypothetical protein